MESKTIVFDGGPLHNTFRVVPIDTSVFEFSIELPKTKELAIGEVQYDKRYYKKTTTKYNNVEVFVYIELKPKDESNNESTETIKV